LPEPWPPACSSRLGGTPTPSPCTPAHAAETGVLSALSAAHGVSGASDILEGEVGFGAAMSEGCDWSLATNGFGEDYNITRMTFKNHGCCGHAFAAIDGALALSNQHQFDPADILNIRVDGYSATVDICGSNTHATPYEGRFSVPYLVATALTHGSARLDAFTEARLTDPATTALTAKVDVRLDDEIDAEFPGRRAARLCIKMRDGSVLEHYQKTRRGDPDMPLTDDELEDKFMELTGPVMGEKASIGLLDACRSLETLGSVRDLPKVGPLSAVQSA
jgi:2-methylcitrate dehydratase PrpD